MPIQYKVSKRCSYELLKKKLNTSIIKHANIILRSVSMDWDIWHSI